MAGRAHLKLIVSESAPPELDEAERGRCSMIVPIGTARRRPWSRTHSTIVALWSTSAVLILAIGLIALGWL